MKEIAITGLSCHLLLLQLNGDFLHLLFPRGLGPYVNVAYQDECFGVLQLSVS